MIRQQGAGFPPNMRVGLPRQPPMGMIQRSERPVMGRPPAPPIDRYICYNEQNLTKIADAY